MSRLLDITVYLVYLGALVYLSGLINDVVPDPYMDELMHVPQGKVYCKGMSYWAEWDNRITTPPGLYILTSTFKLCDTRRMRWVNTCMMGLMPILIASLHKSLRQPRGWLEKEPVNPMKVWKEADGAENLGTTTALSVGKKSSVRKRGATSTATPPPSELSMAQFRTTFASWALKRSYAASTPLSLTTAVTISLFPPLFFFGFLYYTDVGSLFFVLTSYWLGLEANWWLSAIFGATSLFFRQTNIIWLLFILSHVLIRKLDILDFPLSEASSTNLFRSFIDLITTPFRSKKNFVTTLRVAGPFIPVFFGAVIFVLYNDGIVLGDKSNHVPTLHFPQLLYFAAFTIGFMLPLLGWKVLRRTMLSSERALSWRVMGGRILGMGVTGFFIKRYTVVHPFLLADNRHYAFYVWRRIIGMKWWTRYALVPGYLGSIEILFELLSRSKTLTLLPLSIFIVSLFLTLIPSPLIEPRYFLIPFIFLRLNITPTRSQRTKELVFYALINAATIWAFLYRPFKWPGWREREMRMEGPRGDEMGWMRFMW